MTSLIFDKNSKAAAGGSYNKIDICQIKSKSNLFNDTYKKYFYASTIL